MQGNKIYIIEHESTGAKVPMRLHKLQDGTIKYQEVTDNRRAFDLLMLRMRWSKSIEEVTEILNKYKIPGHLDHRKVSSLSEDFFPLLSAIFFEEYIYAIEKKLQLPHNKLKSRLFTNGK